MRMGALDKYSLLSKLGEGTYGVVFKAYDSSRNLVAIKSFKAPVAGCDDTSRRTAQRELDALRKVNHPNIVQLLDAFDSHGRLHIVLEYIDKTLLDVVTKAWEEGRTGLPPVYIQRFMFQLLHGIAHLHSKGIIHRDIKPENVLVNSDGQIKICDLGFSRSARGEGGRYSQYVATRWYRAPELLLGQTEYGFAVDIWAAGCLLVEMASGQPLFPGSSDADQLYLIMKTSDLCAAHKVALQRHPVYHKLPCPSSGSTLRGKFSPLLCENGLAVLEAALEPDPNQRPSAAQLMRMEFFDGVRDFMPSMPLPIDSHDHNGGSIAERTNMVFRGRVPNILASTPPATDERAIAASSTDSLVDVTIPMNGIEAPSPHVSKRESTVTSPVPIAFRTRRRLQLSQQVQK